MISPITGTTDVQASINTVQLGVHQRLQTKRGPIGRRRIVDFMTLDATTTYFPTANRDNFGTPWGQTMYNYQWYLGDRTSIVCQGWFEFWKLVGSTPLNNNLTTGYNPNGLNIITTGINLCAAAAFQHLPRLHDHRHRADQDLGPERVDQLLAQPEVVWYVRHVVRLRRRGRPGLDVSLHPDRGRLLDDHRPVGGPAA